MERLLIPWSGGLDSTLLVVRALEHSKAELHTTYIDIRNNYTKVWCEEQAIDELRKRLKIAFRDFTHHNSNSYNLHECMQQGASYQPFLWLVGLLPIASIILDQDITIRVQIGYIRSDDATQEFEKIQHTWKTLWNQVLPDFPSPTLEAPLRFMNKRDVIQTLRRYEEHRYVSVIDQTWSCESLERKHNREFSGYVACGECDTCQALNGS